MPRITKVLIANRGEIAVRVIRAARDSGIALGRRLRRPGPRRPPREARRRGVRPRRHHQRRDLPRDRQAALGRPPLRRRRRAPRLRLPRRERRLRPRRHRRRPHLDRPVARRHRAPRRQGLARVTSPRRSGAPLAPGTLNPVADAAEVLEFVDEHGLPVAIKAAFGGGGRGLKVARTREEVPELFESATREAIAAFGRGECFVEKYLDEPRHVETQCLADAARQRRRRLHPRLLAAAPPPEARRGGARAVPHRGAEPRALRRVEGHPQGGRLRRRRHLRVPHRQGRHRLVPRGEHAPAGRAPGLRGGHRHRPRARAVPPRRGRRARLRRPDRRAATRSSSASTARTPGRNFLPVARPGARAALPRRPRRARRHRRDHRRRDLGRVRLAARQAHRHRLHPRGGARALPPRPRRVRGRRPAHRAARSTATSCATPRSPPTATSRSRSTRAGSRPSSTTTIEPWCGRARRGHRPGSAHSVVVEVDGHAASRSPCPQAARRRGSPRAPPPGPRPAAAPRATRSTPPPATP